MSLIKQFVDGSLLSKERLMRAREFYSPAEPKTSSAAALSDRAQRVSVQSELASARELAGLSDEELGALEAEFLRCQIQPRPTWQLHALLAGGALVALACLGFALQGTVGTNGLAAKALPAIGVACLLAGLVPLGAVLVATFSRVPLDLAYGTTGVLVGQLDERHPWLYKATTQARHEAADAYRQRVLNERGLLRGADFIVMREIVRAHEALEQMQPARAVAEQLQLLPVPADAGAPEPRLVRVKAGGGRS